MKTYRVTHSTRYEYEVPVVHAHHLAYLRPRRLSYQSVQESEVRSLPVPQGGQAYADYFGNDCDAIEILEQHDCLEVIGRSRVTVSPRALSLEPPKASGAWEAARDRFQQASTDVEAQEFRCDSPLVRAHPVFREYGKDIFAPGRTLGEAVLELNRRIHEDFTYEPAATDVSTPLAQVMRERRGVCQDFAHVAIACLRSFGLPARYVSGYMETLPPPGAPKLVGADASHAWAAALIPQHGWLEFDPTNGLLPEDRHITVAWGRDFSDVSPLKGVVLGGGKHLLSVGVDVEALDEDTT